MGTTTKDLVSDLEKLPDSAARKVLLEAARAGSYHDFKTDRATPKMDLVADLLSAAALSSNEGYVALSEKVKAGAYDDERPGDK